MKKAIARTNIAGGSRKALKNVLVKRFLKGDRLTVEDVIGQYFKYGSKIQYLNARDIVRPLMSYTIRKIINGKYGLTFGEIEKVPNSRAGIWGIPKTEGESSHQVTAYYTRLKGVHRNAVNAANYGTKNKLLPRVKKERLAVPLVVTARK